MRAEELFAHIGNIPAEKRTALADRARLFLTSEKYRPEFSELEKEALCPFFTNTGGRVFFIHSLPEAVVSVLMAMYSRLKNKRGIRGVFVDSLLPHILSSGLSEVAERFGGDPDVFLKQNRIHSLASFVNHSGKSRAAFVEFRGSFGINPEYVQRFTDSPKVKKFLTLWLDSFGHNSIARVSKIVLCSENISLLAAKSFEWTRPGSGYIELSTRYVDMSGKDLYPIDGELSEFGISSDDVRVAMDSAFACYRHFQGEDFNGPLPSFLNERYRDIITDAKDLERGVIGETCDVLGNFLPCATLTSLGTAVSGEAFPQLLKHLILDGTPENLVLAEMILEENSKLGYGQFSRHFEPTEWEKSAWQYLDEAAFLGFVDRAPRRSSILNISSVADELARKILLKGFSSQPQFRGAFGPFENVIEKLKAIPRSEFGKLPNHFESVAVAFSGVMSFRSWRDLQRQQLATHYRTYVAPNIGFYCYDKPAPPELEAAFDRIMKIGGELYDRMKEKAVPPQLMQYPLAMGNLIGFRVAGNLSEMEFCDWQRTKFGVNHEVRQIFLDIESALRAEYPWWKEISRADMTPAYIFARTGKGIVLS